MDFVRLTGAPLARLTPRCDIRRVELACIGISVGIWVCILLKYSGNYFPYDCDGEKHNGSDYGQCDDRFVKFEMN
jgi:hypothetical protein